MDHPNRFYCEDTNSHMNWFLSFSLIIYTENISRNLLVYNQFLNFHIFFWGIGVTSAPLIERLGLCLIDIWIRILKLWKFAIRPAFNVELTHLVVKQMSHENINSVKSEDF